MAAPRGAFGRPFIRMSAPPTAPRVDPEGRMRALVEAVAARKDRAAFAELFGHFAPRLKSFIMRGGADPDTAEEVAQEAMIQVWRRADTFDPTRAAVSTWVFTIARNKRIDRIRRERHPSLTEEEYLAAMPAAERGDDAAEASQTEARLARSIETLPPDQAEVVRLAFYQDKSHSAIAEDLKLPLGTVKSRIRLALGRLRAVVTEDEK